MKKKFLDKQGLAEFCNSFKDKFVKKDEIKTLIGDVKPDLSEYAKKSETLDKDKDKFITPNNWRVTDLLMNKYKNTYVNPQSVVNIVNLMASQIGYADDLTSHLQRKVDKVSGKDLSSNDYTNEDKDKLKNMPIPTFLEKEQYESLSEKEKMDNTKLYYTYVERQ